MSRVWNGMAVVVLAGFMLVACQSTTGKTAGQNVSDAAISTKVQSKLTADRMSNFSRIDVDTERGVVILTGVVDSADQKMKATELARQIDGVKDVKNNLQIQSRTP